MRGSVSDKGGRVGCVTTSGDREAVCSSPPYLQQCKCPANVTERGNISISVTAQ